ncbi:uncharacterized protein RAG0_10309 [Rhynchosporium agropyri]|uniref:Uncharacterized protein n=1 Tax=Rhynchosporium agropyri TaxID=914238 RepID=A0A1E1KZA5_9HELO|nr:uncharacterized protein RAG0_10309 [Rhynchosporium agropyri]
MPWRHDWLEEVFNEPSFEKTCHDDPRESGSCCKSPSSNLMGPVSIDSPSDADESVAATTQNRDEISSQAGTSGSFLAAVFLFRATKGPMETSLNGNGTFVL